MRTTSARIESGTVTIEHMPEGGYVIVSGIALLAAWWAYNERLIRYQDLRCWFALLELLSQRRASKRKSRLRLDIAALSRLAAGAGDAAIRASLRRLEAAAMIVRAESSYELPVPQAADEATRLWSVIQLAPHVARPIPLPRRMVRFLACNSKPVLTATILGHALRCLFLKSGRCSARGLCKATWIAIVFHVHERNVKAARKELVRLGWLTFDPAGQRFMNRWGKPARINLAWKPDHQRHAIDDPTAPAAELPPPLAANRAELPPPKENQNPCTRSKNQNPLPQQTGACKSNGREGEPALSNVQPHDLRSPERLEALFQEAVNRRLVQQCDADRLRLFAAAARARSLGATNPCGFFAAIVMRGLWHVINQRDEDAARNQLRKPHITKRHAQAMSAHPRVSCCSEHTRFTSPSRAGDLLSEVMKSLVLQRSSFASGPNDIGKARNRQPEAMMRFPSRLDHVRGRNVDDPVPYQFHHQTRRVHDD